MPLPMEKPKLETTPGSIANQPVRAIDVSAPIDEQILRRFLLPGTPDIYPQLHNIFALACNIMKRLNNVRGAFSYAEVREIIDFYNHQDALFFSLISSSDIGNYGRAIVGITDYIKLIAQCFGAWGGANPSVEIDSEKLARALVNFPREDLLTLNFPSDWVLYLIDGPHHAIPYAEPELINNFTLKWEASNNINDLIKVFSIPRENWSDLPLIENGLEEPRIHAYIELVVLLMTTTNSTPESKRNLLDQLKGTLDGLVPNSFSVFLGDFIQQVDSQGKLKKLRINGGSNDLETSLTNELSMLRRCLDAAIFDLTKIGTAIEDNSFNQELLKILEPLLTCLRFPSASKVRLRKILLPKEA